MISLSKTIQAATTSPWPTVGGVLAAVGGVVMGVVASGKPEAIADSMPGWLIWIGLLALAVGPVIAGTAARQNDVTSRQAGAEPNEVMGRVQT